MRLPIRTKLAIGFSLALLMLVLITFYSLRVGQQSLEESVKKHSEYIAGEVLRDLRSDIFTIIDTMQIETSQDQLQEALLKSNRLPEAQSNDKIQFTQNRALIKRFKDRFFDHYKDTVGYQWFEHLVVIDKKGDAIVSVGKTDNYSHRDEPWWQTAKENGVFIGNVMYEQDSGHGIIPLTTRIDDKNGDFLGFIHLAVLTGPFFRTMEMGLKKYQTTQIHLLSGKGKRLFSTQTFRFMEDISGTDYFKKITGEHGSFFATIGKKDKLCSYSRLGSKDGFNNSQWIIVVENDKAEILRPMTRLRNNILIAFAVLTLMVILVALLISNSIIKPVKALEKGVKIVGKGDLDY
jgi:hypothetical protein